MIEKLKTNYNCSLRNIYEQTSQSFRDLPWENVDFYAEWLAQTFFMVSHTPRLICLAAARFGIESDTFHRQMIGHFSDEDAHEYVLLNDLKSLGFDIADFSESPETSLIVQQLYHLIDRVDPSAIYGRILFLELMTAELDAEFSDRIISKYKANESHFLKIHLEEDIEHVEKAAEIIEKVPLEKQKIIGDSFYMTGFLYQQFLNGVFNRFKSKAQVA